jgi:hypothetical protein
MNSNGPGRKLQGCGIGTGVNEGVSRAKLTGSTGYEIRELDIAL